MTRYAPCPAPDAWLARPYEAPECCLYCANTGVCPDCYGHGCEGCGEGGGCPDCVGMPGRTAREYAPEDELLATCEEVGL